MYSHWTHLRLPEPLLRPLLLDLSSSRAQSFTAGRKNTGPEGKRQLQGRRVRAEGAEGAEGLGGMSANVQ